MTTKLLLVDDEPGVRTTLAGNLELEGFEVFEAESGRDALRMLQDNEFDVVLTDIRMPGMSGVELFQEIKRRNLRTPVVLTTAFFAEGQVDGALREGAFAVLPKPSHVADVVAILSRAARRPFVLIIDDSVSASSDVTTALGLAGLRARVAVDGPSAIALVGSGDVDVCVVSLTSSAAGAIEELYRLAPELAVVTLSAEGAPELLQGAIARAAFACLRKPVQTGDLVQIVAEARGRRCKASRPSR